MKRDERYEIPTETIIHALESWQAGIYTAMPGIITSFNPEAQTLSVQPAINRLFTDYETGEQTWLKMPLLLDVVMIMVGGGGMTLTTPINIGDECLVHFSDRCIDAWWQNGCAIVNGSVNTQNQAEFRMHDLSDGFAIVGLRSQPRKLANYSTTSMQLRSDDGNCIIDLNPTTHDITMTCPTLTINGNLEVTGTASVGGDATINGRGFMSHEHSGVQTGSGNSSGVV